MAFNINNKEEANKPKSHSQDFIPSFIRKTYDILEEARFPQYIDWNPEGTALVIKKPSEFSQKVLPIYFKHNNFTSFVRQLNMYDFHKKRTQGLDHVYIHELFQKGKRHLLQGIKRKTHEHTGEKIPKAPEVQPISKTVPEDLSSLFKENQLIKHLYNEAMNRLAALERRAKELATQNQTLMSQIYCQNTTDNNSAFKPNIARIESQTELTQDQLPMTLGKMTLNLAAGYKPQAPVTRLFTQTTAATYMKPAMNPVRTELYREESTVSGASTEVSRGSPVVQSGIDNEEVFEIYQSVPAQADQFSSFPKGFNSQAPAAFRITSELSISRQEMSAGQMIDSWNMDLGNDELICFADQKPQAMYQDRSLLGKRLYEPSADMSFYVNEPAMKRPAELCIGNRMGLISAGTEDQEGMDNNLYVNNVMPAVGGYDQQMGIDSMEF